MDLYLDKEIPSKTKQVIVVRKDLNVHKGKMIAQGAHASLGAILQRMEVALYGNDDGSLGYCRTWHPTDVEYEWLSSSFRKICVGVENEEELIHIYKCAERAGLNVKLITDNGDTEFGGVPTKTCLAIGPDYDEKIDPITGHLSLY